MSKYLREREGRRHLYISLPIEPTQLVQLVTNPYLMYGSSLDSRDGHNGINWESCWGTPWLGVNVSSTPYSHRTFECSTYLRSGVTVSGTV